MKKVILIFAAIILLLSTTNVTGKTVVLEVPTQMIHTHTRIQLCPNLDTLSNRFIWNHKTPFLFEV